ncbi:ribosome silencing factor [Ideonella sp. A 288]|nr:ribosome silencing factor [Ideonella sp. A 288]
MDIRKLQRAIVDGLEDVKAQNIVVFNTEHLSPLFERVIIASGTSNRQTKALASSVRVAVKGAGLPVLSTEGSDNGEWIIVDCGPAVAHIMQPSIRDYYRLEEIWGGKPVKMKIGSDEPKGLVKASADAMDDEPARKPAARKSAAAKPAAKVAARSGAKPAAGQSAAGKPAARKAAPGKAVAGKGSAPVVTSMSGTVGKAATSSRSTTAAKKSAIPSKQATAAVKKVVVAAKKTAPSRKTAPAKAPARAPVARKAAPTKAAPARKTTAAKRPANGSTARKKPSRG